LAEFVLFKKMFRRIMNPQLGNWRHRKREAG
jgi:hypothetical protein